MCLPNHLRINVDEADLSSLLSSWRWLVGQEYRPLLMTFIGDLFLIDPEGGVFFLELSGGTLEKVTENVDKLKELLSTPQKRRDYVPGFLYSELKTILGPLKQGECYSCKIPFTLGGDLDPENFDIAPIDVHFHILGQLQSQITSLPAGTKISKFIVDDGKVDLIIDREPVGILAIVKKIFR